MRKLRYLIAIVLTLAIMTCVMAPFASAFSPTETGTYNGYGYAANLYGLTGSYGASFSYSGSSSIRFTGSVTMRFSNNPGNTVFPLYKKGTSSINQSGLVQGYSPISGTCTYSVGGVDVTTLTNNS